MIKTWSMIAAIALCEAPPLQGQINVVFEIPDSERETIFLDDFDSDATAWSLDSDDDVKLKIDGGHYVIDRMKKEGNYMLLHDGFDFSEDFTIEARMRKAKGDDDSVWFGLVWAYMRATRTTVTFSSALTAPTHSTTHARSPTTRSSDGPRTMRWRPRVDGTPYAWNDAPQP